nr:MAG TPA: hypothetical protein [Caudoviricetes sp.]
MKLLNGMRFTGKNGEHYELNIAPLIKNTFIDNTIALNNKDTGVVERINLDKFKSLVLDRNYKYTVSRVDVVIEPGKVASGEVYFGVEDDSVYTVDGFLDGVEDVAEVIHIYTIAAVYEDDPVVQSLRMIHYMRLFSMHKICNIDGEKYITNGVIGDHVDLRKLDNSGETKAADSYNSVTSIDNFRPVSIGYAFTRYGLLPVLTIYDDKAGKNFCYTVFNEKYFIGFPERDVYRIGKTQLTIPINTEDDLPSLAKVCVDLFAYWAYDYRSMIPAIENVFGKDE